MDNLILTADSYKVTHHYQYPPKTEYIYSYFESRGGKFPEIVFFGLQYIIKKWLTGPVVTEEKIKEAKDIFKLHFNNNYFNEDGWNYILKEHNGHLPIRIKAVPEGSVIPVRNVLFTIENTDPHCYWLPNYLETLLEHVWYPMTVATISRQMKKIIKSHLEETSESNVTGLPFALHDFGYRGSTSVESASIGGCAHLVNFKGTDNIGALIFARRYYHCQMAGFSIAATEHSTITSWGESNEQDAYRNVLEKFPNSPVSCVSDSYNLWRACSEMWAGDELMHILEKREFPLVIRPDSGEPAKILVELLELLEDKFKGISFNEKGFKLLPKYLRVIQGDGINVDSLSDICKSIQDKKWSMENFVFGCGGGLLQKLDRDTQKCAFKCSYACVNGEERNVFKNPITDQGKKSKKGRLTLQKIQEIYETIEEGKGDPTKDILIAVFENGHLMKDYTLEEIRINAKL